MKHIKLFQNNNIAQNVTKRLSQIKKDIIKTEFSNLTQDKFNELLNEKTKDLKIKIDFNSLTIQDSYLYCEETKGTNFKSFPVYYEVILFSIPFEGNPGLFEYLGTTIKPQYDKFIFIEESNLLYKLMVPNGIKDLNDNNKQFIIKQCIDLCDYLKIEINSINFKIDSEIKKIKDDFSNIQDRIKFDLDIVNTIHNHFK